MKKYVTPELDIQVLYVDKTIAALDLTSIGEGDGVDFEEMFEEP